MKPARVKAAGAMMSSECISVSSLGCGSATYAALPSTTFQGTTRLTARERSLCLSFGGRGGSYAYEYVSQGGLTFVLEFDYDKRIAKILNQEISLNETNVVLVDFVDSTNGPAIVGYRWVDPGQPAGQAAPVDPIAGVIGRTPELFEYLRCDLDLGR